MDSRSNETDQFLRDLADGLMRFGNALAELHVRVQPAIESFVDKVVRASQVIAPYLEAFVRWSHAVDAIQLTGWLPHRSIKINDLEPYLDNTVLLEQHISNHYEKNWADIRQDIVTHLNIYEIDDHTRAAFYEALHCHDNGHYRCVCAILFPEIERTFRLKFSDNATGQAISEKKVRAILGTADIRYLILDNPLNVVLFRYVTQHIYQHVNDQNLADIEANDCPNRHAVVHGIVCYNTQKQSINMIVLFDYILQFISAIDAGYNETTHS